MKPQKTAFQLPRYCRRKPLKSGRWAYYFEPPTWAREQGCHVKAQPLGEDYAAAVERAKCVLLPSFDSWHSRGLTDIVPVGVPPGSFDWLIGVFKGHRKWKEIDHKTQRSYEQGLALFADYWLKDSTRAGSKQISDITRSFVDAVYAKLLIIEEKDADGNVVQRERRRYANAAMTACRRAWFVGQRAEEEKVPAVNPFSKMGLRARAPGQPIRETPIATWDELIAFRAKANELGYRSVATAALVAWEWLQREEHVFGAFEISHYRPKERPNSVRIVHPKNGEDAWWPLFDETGGMLFPELMAELDEIKRTNMSGLVFRRDHMHRRSPIPLPWITAKQDLRYLREIVKKIVRAAALREKLSFSSFRHGGFTEAADSGLTDAELRAAGCPGRRGRSRPMQSAHEISSSWARRGGVRNEKKQPICRMAAHPMSE